jgi:hypothetical protein
MHVGRFSGEAAAVAAAALAPCAWREFSSRMVARRVLGALDHFAVLDFLSDIDGVDLGTVEAIELTAAEDPRVEPLVAGLDGEHWRSTSLVRLSAGLVASLERWYIDRGVLDPDLLDDV